MTGQLQHALEKQLVRLQQDYLASSYHERTAKRADYRNGFYCRKQVVTPVGTLNPVRVPRCRRRGFRQVIEGDITRGLEQLTPASERIKTLSEDLAGVYPHVPHQVCWFHKLSNVLKCVRKTDRKDVAEELRKIYHAETRTAALTAA